MAGEIAQEVAVALALGSAAIGAGGSILSQVVAGVITSRREKKKARADEKRWQLESDAKRRDRSLDHKIALFARFMASVQGIERAEAWGNPITHATFMGHSQTLDELQRVVEEIGLIAPEVHRHARAAYVSLNKMLIAKVRTDKDDQDATKAVSRAEESLGFWIGLTRTAIRSYINHEPVDWPEQAIAEHKRRPKEDVKLLDEASQQHG